MESELFERAKHCSSCLDWHGVCDAECCKKFTVSSKRLLVHKSNFEKGLVVFLPPSSFDVRRYLRLHGVVFVHGFARVKAEKVVFAGGVVVVFRRCSWLDNDNLCLGHPDDKPWVCKNFTVETFGNKEFGECGKCLFKYKRGGGVGES